MQFGTPVQIGHLRSQLKPGPNSAWAEKFRPEHKKAHPELGLHVGGNIWLELLPAQVSRLTADSIALHSPSNSFHTTAQEVIFHLNFTYHILHQTAVIVKFSLIPLTHANQTIATIIFAMHHKMNPRSSDDLHIYNLYDIL